MISTYRVLLACFVCATLAGCGSNADLKEKLGLNREGPDEYRIVPRPPLSMPPEFNLRPPVPQQSDSLSGKPAEAKAHDQVLGVSDIPAPAATAETAVIPVTSGNLAGNPGSGSDAQFLADIGTAKADPQIRQKLDLDRKSGAATKDSNYLFGGKKQGDSVVDATKEADRLKTDQAQGKPVTAGDTPVVVPKDTGILGDIF